MSEAPANTDFGKLLTDIRDSVSSFIQSGQSRMTGAGVDEDDIKAAVLTALSESAKNGNQIIEHIALASAGQFAPKESEIFPLLNQMTEEGLVSFEITNEVKSFKISKTGKAWLSGQSSEPKGSYTKPKPMASECLQAKAELSKHAMRMGQAIVAVASMDDTAKIKAATKIVENATRELFGIAGGRQ